MPLNYLNHTVSWPCADPSTSAVLNATCEPSLSATNSSVGERAYSAPHRRMKALNLQAISRHRLVGTLR